MDRLRKIVADEALLWGHDVRETYHRRAEADMERKWTTCVHPFLKGRNIDYEQTIDFACGYGRNAAKLADLATHVTLVDVNQDNIEHCRSKFRDGRKFSIVQNNGYDISELKDEGYTFVYSFDAMVHFDVELIICYLNEFRRVLRPGGHAFVHHSNYAERPGADFRTNPSWRNYMTAGLFEHLALKAGFAEVEQQVIDWGGTPEIDCLSLARKG